MESTSWPFSSPRKTRSLRTKPGRSSLLRIAAVPLVFFAAGVQASSSADGDGGAPVYYRPDLRPPDVLEPFLPHLAPGSDAFASEKEAAELSARLADLGRKLRAEPARAATLVEPFLAPGAKGMLLPSAETTVAEGRFLQVFRGAAPPDAAAGSKDRRALAQDLAALVAEWKTLSVAEFLITAIEVDRTKGRATTRVHFDFVGADASGNRGQRTGGWRLVWQRGADGTWRIDGWTAQEQERSRTAGPVFTETTATAFGNDPAFRAQLTTPLDAWMSVVDWSVTRDSNGHHGVSVGDADGDGLEDLFVAQPHGFPNRLFRAKGDGTFEDMTERAGLGLLDDTSQGLFADIDNDGDQDLVLATAGGPLLYLNDGQGHFTLVPGAFQLKDPIQGSLTSMAIGDYDRDGFPDLYLCAYSYFIGMGEDKGGVPAPYHDARNGPPSVLFRNDGHGRFVDATAESGIGAANDRFHFAAAFADYDGDGWPDLLVANDFGTKNLFHNEGRNAEGRVTFRDVAATAGVLDHGAGMSAAFVDYDNDGRLDIYTGNMWTATGQRITADPAYLPTAPPEVRALYRHHTRGNSLLRNRGDGTFEDVTLAAGVAMGRWAWCSDAVDFDGDGFEDLYAVNGMFTRDPDQDDLDGFFWRQVTARSPLTRVTGTPYDDSWRAMNQVLVHRGLAAHERNVLLRNDGHGHFDDVSGASGLDLEQDGRSFAVFDYDQDGDPDLVLLAARQAPQLRLFRNDFAGRGGSLAVRLRGRPDRPQADAKGGELRSSRDAIGARVVVETDLFTRTRIVQAGSGFISQHSKELLFGLGQSQKIVKVTVHWPDGRVQELRDVALGQRLRIEEGEAPIAEPFHAASTSAGRHPAGASTVPLGPATGGLPASTWFYEPFPAPDFTLPDTAGRPHSLADLRGRPSVLLFWRTDVPASRTALRALAEGSAALERARIGSLAVALDGAGKAGEIRAAAAGLRGVPVLVATPEMASAYTILHRYLFLDRQDLRIPTVFLLSAAGEVVKTYRGAVDAATLVADAAVLEAAPAERLARAVPFPGAFQTPIGARNYLPYGRDLLEQGFEGPALGAFERAALGTPTAYTLYTLGTLFAKTRQPEKARAAFLKALEKNPALAEAENDLGALLAQGGDMPAGIERFRAALRITPDYPDALNNLGYALLLVGRENEAQALYEKALALQPDFPEALNNVGLILARRGNLGEAEPYFRRALEARPGYGEAANNLALVLVGRRQADAAVTLLEGFVAAHPEFEDAYVTLAKLYMSTMRNAEAQKILERLLQRDPSHPVGTALARELRSTPPSN